MRRLRAPRPYTASLVDALKSVPLRPSDRASMVEVFLPFRNSPVAPVRDVRSTLIMAGIQSLREQGLFQRYSETISSDLRERIAGLAAGIWVPVEIAVAHYSAMDRLGIEPHTIEA